MSLVISEWPEGVAEYMADAVFDIAFKLREVSGVPMVPSPLAEAHVRFEAGTSRHAIGADGQARKSDGTDLFLVDNQDAPEVWLKAQQVDGLGGFGIYFDTQLGGTKRVMIHVDGRPNRMVWLCPDQDKREYIYYHNDPSRFLTVLSLEFAKL
ncbi:MAG: hypothetical protein KAT00_00125 [Planctomycetes bacterium]|nr:hypothetical protein [Planctomycetota bacterium]